MSQVLRICFIAESWDSLDVLLCEWNVKNNTKRLSKKCYELSQSEGEGPLIATLLRGLKPPEAKIIEIEGYTTDESWETLEKFARSIGASISHDDELVGNERAPETSTKVTFFGAIVTLGITIVIILLTPFMLIYAGMQLVFGWLFLRD